ncbi:RICIN domain-containing protein [Aquimarina sp. 2201CG14-23]|uniref:RICIN domain-containing protein n=1 Tax=Aquimarina mycalae TaxID=3040073 RepID=UPI002477DE26|nr:RICIN domain-containing protein [Aquimarina sp. 2201CG14-23]MDH7445801.1 RICIN domain-containing protein [Aquimarina sp. 2201CG14-23]
MKTHVTHWKGKSLPFLAKTFLLLSFILTLSCESEEFVELTESNIEEETFQKATPVAGKTYYLRNKKSGLHMDVQNKSNSNGANIQQWGNASGTHRQWTVISVGNGYYRLKGVDSGKSITVKNGSNSNGANIESRAYNGSSHQEWQIISVGSGYYRLKSRDSGKSIGVAGGSTSNGGNVESRSWNGNDKFRWFFTEVGGTTPPPPPPPGGGTAASIIGSGWKLNGFSGNLNVGSNDNGLNYADNASKNESHFFFENNGYATFRCYPGNPTSGGSSNPRSELRELVNGGDNYWDGTTNTEHSMKWRFRIEDLPPSGKLCFGQIHERNDSYDDVIRVQVQGSNGQNSGGVDLRILGYVTEEIEGQGRTINFDMNMDTEYYFELTMRNSVVRLYELNNSGSRVRTLFTSVDIGDADENYFKAGAYLQSTSSSHSSSNVYGQVAIKDLSVN